jgi:hypothetical protein
MFSYPPNAALFQGVISLILQSRLSSASAATMAYHECFQKARYKANASQHASIQITPKVLVG